MVTVAAWTGLRQGNIIKLKGNQVNLFARTITLDSSETKNQENLVIPISAPALEALKDAMRVTHFKSSYVFCKKDGSPYCPTKIRRGLKKALELAGIEDFRFHDLRTVLPHGTARQGLI